METIIERNVAGGGSAAANNPSAVSWGAILAGAAAAAAMSLILFILGIGLGLGAVSPWSGEGISGTTLGVSTILWVTLTSLVAAGLGGYLTGRLRTRWLSVHSDEVYFRDTAHGFLAWGVATLLTAVLFTATTAGIAGLGAKATAALAGGAADVAGTAVGAAGAAGAGMVAGEEGANPLAYHLDTLLRTDVLTPVRANSFQVQPATTEAPAGQPQEPAAGNGAANNAAPPQPQTAGAGAPSQAPAQGQQAETFPALAEVSRIFVRAIQNEQLPQEDLTYVGRLVARHTGIAAADAEMRVSAAFDNIRTELQELETSARQAADEARATSAKVALWFFVALLAGAFTGSFAATIGGRQRDL